MSSLDETYWSSDRLSTAVPGIQQYCNKLWLGLGVEVTYNSPRITLYDFFMSIWALI